MVSEKTEKTNVGGQAVIEGVMMRSPLKVSVAVRKPSGVIAVKTKEFASLTKKYKFLGWPIIRGGVILIESLVLGIQALNFSGEVAMEEEKRQEALKKGKPIEEKSTESWQTQLGLALMVVFSLAAGMAIFFYLPLFLTQLMGIESGIWFNLVDGLYRLVIFLLYLILISQWKEIRRVFEYHGAEHKSIYAYESENQVNLEVARKYTTYHPRCGTSFLLIVLVISIFVFVFQGKPSTIWDYLIRFASVPIIGGFSYELIKLSAKFSENPFVKLFITPGLWLQRITTQEPDDKQLEVALVALKASLGIELPENIEIVIDKGK
ncbi:DUF1385 domain-containing protein [candidate division KSB1 bacterium]|nr:DUF1385 domain-containing protein [candidate division KSB1 bacterium]